MPLTERQKLIYASAPVNAVYWQALRLNHPAFSSVHYIVNSDTDKFWRYSPTDNLYRRFVAVPFKALEPKLDAQGQFDLQIQIDNVHPYLQEEIENALEVDGNKAIDLSYTVYADNDPFPQLWPPMRLTISTVVASTTYITATASRPDVVNFVYPRRYYTIDEFPGLQR